MTDMMNGTGEFLEETCRTRSLERAETIISFLRAHAGEPIPVQEVAVRTESYYEDALHVITTLEALGLVQRYRRDGSPREGARIAYCWLVPTDDQNRTERTTYKKTPRKIAA